MIVADTHALVWALEGSDRLGPDSRQTLDAALVADELAVSAISFWEIALLIDRGDSNWTNPFQRGAVDYWMQVFAKYQ